MRSFDAAYYVHLAQVGKGVLYSGILIYVWSYGVFFLEKKVFHFVDCKKFHDSRDKVPYSLSFLYLK